VILIGPHEFRTAQYYVLASIGIGVIIFIVQMMTEPAAMRSEPPSLNETPESVQST